MSSCAESLGDIFHSSEKMKEEINKQERIENFLIKNPYLILL